MAEHIPWRNTVEYVFIIFLRFNTDAKSDLVAEPLSLTSGVIWTALNIDYPGHSFSHLGVFYGGVKLLVFISFAECSLKRDLTAVCLIKTFTTPYVSLLAILNKYPLYSMII